MADPYAEFQAPAVPVAAKPSGDPYAEFQGPQLLPHNKVSPTLPDNLPETMASYLPAAGGLIGSILAPEVGIPTAMLYAGAGGAAGSALKQGADLALDDSEAPKSAAEFGKTLGMDALGQGFSEGGGRLVGAALQKMFGRYLDPQQLYQSALMPSTAKGTEGVDKVVSAGLNNGIPVSREGKEQALQAWTDLNKQITNIIAQDPNKKIDPQKIVASLNDLRVKYSRGSGDPAYLDAIDKVEHNFLNLHGGLAPGKGSVLNGPGAQETKKGLYDEVRRESPKAWTGEPVPIATEAKSTLANALMKELQTEYPMIGGLNQNEGGLIELEKALDHFVAKEGNRRILPYLAPILAAAAGGGAAGGVHGAEGVGGTAALIMGAHFLRTALEDPTVKSKLGIALSRAAATRLGKVAKTVAPYIPQNVIRFGGQATANAVNPPQDVIANLPPGNHTFRNGQTWRKEANGNFVRVDGPQ